MTLYLKYRPQSIAELDLDQVRLALEKYVKSESLPHAWLFSGSRGVGKTSSARILAKYVNCQGQNKPCNECEMCEAITAGSAIDVVEIDAASNRGIDEIRELRDKARLAPMTARMKVYIIDEVHMLTVEAANALLKVLEEPPANTLFILCTTEAEKLPETVVSRCARVMFKKPTVAEIVKKLEIVARGEGLKIDKGDLEKIAVAGRGSFRDAIKMLEQVIMSGGDAAGTLGLSETVDLANFLELVRLGKRDELLSKIGDLDELGVNFRSFVEQLIWLLRESILEKAGKSDVSVEIDQVEGLAKVFEQMKSTAVSQLPLEIWVIKNTNQGANGKNEKVNRNPEPEGQRHKSSELQSSGKGKYKLEDLAGKWSDVMRVVKPKNHSVEALLRSTKPMSFDGERLELEVFYKFHKDKLETEKCRVIVEEAVGEVFGESGVRLFLKLGQKVRQAPEEITASGVGDDVIAAAEEIFGAQAI